MQTNNTVMNMTGKMTDEDDREILQYKSDKASGEREQSGIEESLNLGRVIAI